MDVANTNRRIEDVGPDNKLKRWRATALAVFIIVALVSSVLAYFYARSQENAYLNNLQARMQTSVEERADALAAWLKSQEDKGTRLVNSDLFRMYASDIDNYAGDISGLIMQGGEGADKPADKPAGISDADAAYLREQFPLLERTLRSFAQLNGFEAGRIINRNGLILISTNSAVISLSDIQRQYIDKCVNDGKTQFAPLYADNNRGLIWDIAMPIFPPQQAGTKVVAVLLISVSASKILNTTMAPSAMMADSDKIRFVQKQGEDYYSVDPATAAIAKIGHPLTMDQAANLPFELRNSLAQGECYSLGLKLAQGQWWLVQESEYAASSTVVRGFWALAFGLALLITLVVGLAGFAMWWSRMSKINQRLAHSFYELANQEQLQRSLLDSINASVLDFICLKSVDGEYNYVNASMAKAFKRPADKLIGQSDQELFGYNTAKRLEMADNNVLQTAQAVFTRETIYIENVQHEFQISKVPYFGEDGEIIGIVSVFRDVTEMVRAQERQNKAMDGIVEAMVTAVEMIDPYLGGHSNRVKILAEAVAQSLNMGEEVVATVKLAANLSQLGKLFVDRALLDKQGVFTEEERAAMREEVQYAAKILRKIDFSLPIYTTVYEMNERPDGSGYPQGLTAGQISPEANILCVVNTFCAMIRPRSYREGLSVERALEIMRANPGQNDPRVVEALEQLIFSPLGDRCLSSLKN